MRKFATFIASFSLILTLLSCSLEENTPSPYAKVLGEWTLVKFATPIGTIEPAVGLGYVEKYVFKEDGTFLKIVEISGGEVGPARVKQASGTFLESGEYDGVELALVLTFDTNKSMAATCDPYEEEYVGLKLDGYLTNFTWAACDGLGYIYARSGVDSGS